MNQNICMDAEDKVPYPEKIKSVRLKLAAYFF